MKFSAFTAVLFSAAAIASATISASAQPITLVVDASKAPLQNIVKTHEVIPVTPGKLTLFYPQWIIGEHAAVGPIQNLAELQITANGKTVSWRRDPYNMYAFNLVVPPGASSLDVNFTYLGSTFGNYSSNRLSTPNIFVIDWNQNVLYPSTGTNNTTTFDPTLILPSAQWKFATALYDAKVSGRTVTFGTTPLERLMDSPLDACINFRQWVLWKDTGAFPGTATLNACADAPQDLAASKATIGHFRKLVREMIAMYGARHWHDYHFLLTLSNVMPGEGVEHHESSDDGERADYLINKKMLERGGDLLSHEFNHSWDGKYRMPDGLYRKNFNIPYDDSLLWVYEGMTQYYGDVMSYRDGIRKAKNWPDHIAAIYANYLYEQGRQWRSLGDTATSAPFLYGSPRGYYSERRGVDFYAEGELMWLKVDSIIRKLSNNTKSLDTFARAFFGQHNTGPITVSYDRQDIINGLNAVQPYDWAAFFHKWIDDIAPKPPNGFTADGWKFEMTSKPPKGTPPTAGIGFAIGVSEFGGNVMDVRFGSPAWKAGLGILQKIVAVNGRKFSDKVLADAITAAHKNHRPIDLLVVKDNMYRTVSISYDGGLLYPHLIRIPSVPDRLDDIVKPLSK